MKKILALISTCLGVSACIAPTGNYNFDQNALPSGIYNKYWAMQPVDDMANVAEFKSDGTATLWRYSCNALNNYKTANKGTLGQLINKIDENSIQGKIAREIIKIERYKLETVGQNEVKLHAIVGSLSTLKVQAISSNQLVLTQKIGGGLLGSKDYTYQSVPDYTKPLCAY